MPRKVNYGIDYDGYGDDDDYDYEYDYDDEVEENGVAAKKMPIKEACSMTVVWRCPICTYDNEDSMSACDICGVLRNPLVKANIKTDHVTA